MFIEVDKIKLPSELDAGAWDRNKGIIAKIAGKTGIGEAMTALASAQTKVKNKLILKYPFPGISRAASLDDLKKDAANKAKELLDDADELADAAGLIVARARPVHEKYRNSALIGKQTREYVATVIDVAHDYRKLIEGEFKKERMNNYIEETAGQIAAKNKNERDNADEADRPENWKLIKTAAKKIIVACESGKLEEELQSEKAKDIWEASIRQPLRVIFASTDLVKHDDPKISAFLKQFSGPLDTGHDKIAWSNIDHKKALVFAKVAEQAAIQVGKLAKEFG